MTSTIDNPGDSKLMNWIREHLSYPHDYCLIWKRQSFKHVPEIIRSMPSPNHAK